MEMLLWAVFLWIIGGSEQKREQREAERWNRLLHPEDYDDFY